MKHFNPVPKVLHFVPNYSQIALTNAENNGAGLSGLDLNSGWNWPAIKNLFDGISTISTKLPSGEVPEQINPFLSRISL